MSQPGTPERPLAVAVVGAGPSGFYAVEALLKAGADVNGRDGDQNTALHLAVVGGDAAMVRILLEAGADPNVKAQDGFTPLHDAAYNGRGGMARMLLAAGASPADITNKDGYTPVNLLHGHPERRELADYLQSVAEGKTPLPTPEEVGLDMQKREAALKEISARAPAGRPQDKSRGTGHVR